MTAARTRLPNRRPSVLDRVTWGGRDYEVCIGFDDAGRAAEAFADGVKSGAGLEAILDDACIAISILMQAGFSADYIAERFSRDDAGEPTSPLGAVAELAARIEREGA